MMNDTIIELLSKLRVRRMYVFLDESYNLKDRSKPQFISISGFMIVPVRKVWKRWREYRRKFAGKWRIHATDAVFEPLREKSFRLIKASPDITLLSVMQSLSEIPVDQNSPYYGKGRLHFDKVYEELLKCLFARIQLNAYTHVTITIDNRKTKDGLLGKQRLQERLLIYLAEYYPSTKVEFHFVPSSSSILLEIADFISNTFYRQYVGQDMPGLRELMGKTILLKNPLK